MTNKIKSDSLCIIPYTQAFMNPNGSYRNCCSTSPQVTKYEKDFINWWTGSEMESLRSSLKSNNLPSHCNRCQKEHQAEKTSMMDVGWRDVDKIGKLPSRFQIGFSNVCNIGCWSCNESYSSIIQEEKKKLNLLPNDYQDPKIEFDRNWPSFKEYITKCYEEHESILINIFGGEPTINKQFVDFLQELVDKNLNHRTKLEIFTNCHNPRDEFQHLIRNYKWKHISILASIDAIGTANDWIRYGSNWEQVETNLHRLKEIADYIEVISTLGVLNAKILPGVKKYCNHYNISHSINLLTEPWFMSVLHWDGPIEFLGDYHEYEHVGYGNTWKQFRTESRSGAHKSLVNYIKQFNRESNQIVDDLIASYS